VGERKEEIALAAFVAANENRTVPNVDYSAVVDRSKVFDLKCCQFHSTPCGESSVVDR